MITPAAVAFDLDGTLVDTADAHGEAYRRAFAEFGIEIDRRAFRAFAGRHHTEIIELLAAGTTAPFDRGELHRLKTREYRSIAASHCAPLPLLSMVRLLHGSTKMALVTSATYETARASLSSWFDIDQFDVVVAADHVSEHKPSPVPYLTAAEALGVQPQEMMVFEDAPPGLASARAAGCLVVEVAGTGQEIKQ